MRMIDRWFPCEAVSEASYQPHGSGMTEKGLFTWFAARPIAQARAAVLTTLLPWPDDPKEQRDLQDLVTDTIKGKPEALRQAAQKIKNHHPEVIRVLDPFSGRGIIPLEIGRAGAEAWGLDYSPVAALAGMLLADFPSRDWSAEPPLPLEQRKDATQLRVFGSDRLVSDIRMILNEIGTRHESDMDRFYPCNGQGDRPWGYLWAQTMPCDECRNVFPLFGSTLLRQPDSSKSDQGQSFSIIAERASGSFQVLLHEGITSSTATLISSSGKIGKIARCPFCSHPHTLAVIKAKGNAGQFRDHLLLVAEAEPKIGPTFRIPTEFDTRAITSVEQSLVRRSSNTVHISKRAVPT